MSRLRTEDGEQESRLRELEAELDSELGLSSSTVTAGRTRKARSGSKLDYGKFALYGLATLVVAHLLGPLLLKIVTVLSLAAFVIFGVMWLVSLFKGNDD